MTKQINVGGSKIRASEETLLMWERRVVERRIEMDGHMQDVIAATSQMRSCRDRIAYADRVVNALRAEIYSGPV